ncbi:ATP synthase F1 subunit delta [Patulibacter brassicae]|jgi:ATP synthase F1 delta subunit|uniref:ATP synthase subunit delta n=1 Tax=Patulibacter brassicae TaxID=1705717 RepID=A0ABU4VKY7_9ACTN|nr:ATP synthase F1 subunit delta [Patulibacter brassicae]MDX8151430.1 ATP synthase F1 subunit delta [Patulibacter brassicae]
MEEIARVYARSLFEVAREKGNLDAVADQLGQIDDAFAESRDLRVYFFSPYFSTAEKRDALGKVVVDAEPILVNLLDVLVENHRLPALPRLRRAFDALWREERKLLPVQITSAVPLDDEAARRIGDEIGRRTGRQIELSTEVDPGLVGGMTLRVGNQILDASIRNRLESLRRQVAAG